MKRIQGGTEKKNMGCDKGEFIRLVDFDGQEEGDGEGEKQR